MSQITPKEKYRMISIRMPVRMINALKAIARRKGVGYQPLVRHFLDESLQMEKRKTR